MMIATNDVDGERELNVVMEMWQRNQICSRFATQSRRFFSSIVHGEHASIYDVDARSDRAG